MIPHLLIGSGVALMISSGAAYWQYDRANDLAAKLGIANERLEQAREIEKDLIRQRAELDRLDERSATLTRERDDAINRLDKHRKDLRERALRDPEDIGRRATRASRRVFESITRSTTVIGDLPPAGPGPGPSEGTDDSRPDAGDDEGTERDGGALRLLRDVRERLLGPGEPAAGVEDVEREDGDDR